MSDLCDRALLLLAFGSGGRRYSEITRLRLDEIEERWPVAADGKAPNGEKLAVLAIGQIAVRQDLLRRRRESVLVVGRSSKLCGPALRYLKSTPVRYFGELTNGEMSVPPHSIRKASTR